jgi:hypothetical protein
MQRKWNWCIYLYNCADETKADSFASAGKVAALPLIVRQLYVASSRLGAVGVILGWWSSLKIAIYALFQFTKQPTQVSSCTPLGYCTSATALLRIGNLFMLTLLS